MIKTIQIGNYIQVQGIFKETVNGITSIDVFGKIYKGTLV